MASFESFGGKEAATGSPGNLEGENLQRNREWFDGFSGVARDALKKSGVNTEDPRVQRYLKALGLVSALAVSGCASMEEGMKAAGVPMMDRAQVVGALVLGGVQSGVEAVSAGTPAQVIVKAGFEGLDFAREKQNKRDQLQMVRDFQERFARGGGEVECREDGVRAIIEIRPATSEDMVGIEKKELEGMEQRKAGKTGNGDETEEILFARAVKEEMGNGVREKVQNNPVMYGMRQLSGAIGSLDPLERGRAYLDKKFPGLTPEEERLHENLLRGTRNGYITVNGKTWIIGIKNSLPPRGAEDYKNLMEEQ